MRHLKGLGRSGTGILLICLALASFGCKPDTKAEAPEIRPVRTVTAARGEAAETVVLTGHIQADDEPAFGFRIGGRVIERPVNIGDRVKTGQVLAKLDPESELSALRSAESALAAAQGQLNYARSAFRTPASVAGQRPHAPSPVRSGTEGAAKRTGAGRRRRSPAGDRAGPRQLDDPYGGCARER